MIENIHPPELPYFDVTLVDGPINQVISDLSGWMRGYQSDSTSLNETDYSPQYQQSLLWQPCSARGKTAITRQDYEHVLSNKFGYRCVSVRSSVNDCEWPINELAVYENHTLRRFVRAFRDDPKWEFFEQGERFPFEDEARYLKRRIRDRLDKWILKTN